MLENTGSRWQSKVYGNVTTATEKKVICNNGRGEGMISPRQCKEPKRAKGFSDNFKDKMLLMEPKEKGVTLDAEVEAFLANMECTAPYDQPLAIATTNIFEVNHKDAYDSDVDEGPILQLLSCQSVIHKAKVVPTESELAKCKLEIVRLDTQQVKLDLERQVRQEQNLVTQRNERNAELEQEKVMLKTHLKSKDVSIEFLKSENQKVLTDKKKLEDKYLDEIDLHKDILGRSNPRYGKKAPVINASNAWDTMQHKPVTVPEQV
ncbi:hypothetical protein Tco_1329325 [Tanacetum coccineum]